MGKTITLLLAKLPPHISVFLMNYGYCCVTAPTQQHVLALIAQRPIDCLIADIAFAVEPVSGITLLAALPAGFPTLLLSHGSALVYQHLQTIYGKPHQEFALYPVDIEEIFVKIAKIRPP